MKMIALRSGVSVAVACVSILRGSVSLAQTIEHTYSPSELRALGREAIDDAIEKKGRDTNPRWHRDVGLVIDSISKAAGYHDRLTWEIIGDSTFNASAVPGGGMIVHVGLPLFCDEYSGALPDGSSAKNRRYLSCMAAVIGHEFAHLALGHLDSIGAVIARRELIDNRFQTDSLRQAVRDKALIDALRFERADELSADKTGALFLMRAGWQVQDAIDLMVAMDSVERSESDWRSQFTWLMDHPRTSERAALLEAFRARLKLDQRDFDDAVFLINNDQMPDSALAMLDRVLKDFPRLPAALHARGAVFARRWLASSAVQNLKVRPSMPAYGVRFMTSIKGSNTDDLNAARKAFMAAFEIDPHPYTLSDLAVLDAYGGDATTALKRATLAAQRAPDDADIQNNLGVVLFLAGRIAEARQAFAKAEEIAGEDLTLAIAYNVARAAVAAGDTARALELIARYVSVDRQSSWGKELLAHQARLGGSTAAASTTPTRRSSTPAPTIARLQLTTPASRIIAIMGKPESAEEEGRAVVWYYPSRQLVLVVDAKEGLLAIFLTGTAPGNVEGVAVGDALQTALKKLGAPADQGKDEGDDVFIFDRGDWVIGLIATNGVVTGISIRTASA